VIQYALDQLTSGRSWKEKVLVKSDCEISSTINVPSYTILEIDGKLKLKDGANCDLIKASNVNDVELIVNGELDGNKANQTPTEYIHCINFDTVSRFKIIAEHVTNAYGANVRVVSCRNGIIDVTRSAYAKRIGLFVGTSEDIIIRANCYQSNEDNCVDFSKCKRVQAILIGAESLGNHGVGVYGCKNCEFIVVAFKNNQSGCYVGPSADGTLSEHLKIIAVCYENSMHGIDIRDGSCSIEVHGDCHTNNRHGILLYNGVHHISVYGNYHNNSQEAAGSYDGVRLHDATYCLVQAIAIDDQATATQAYGIQESGIASDYNIICGCITVGNATGQIAIVGANTVCRRNIGYATENSGVATFSGDGLATSFSWAHGLVGTPSVILVTPKSADAAITHSVSADATNITITFSSAPAAGTDNVVLAWYAEV